MNDARTLREEATICRELAREITDIPSVRMLLERAEDLESRADAIDERTLPSLRRRVS